MQEENSAEFTPMPSDSNADADANGVHPQTRPPVLMTAYVLRAILAGTLVAAAPLGAQATGSAARDSAIRAAALRDTPEASDMRAGINSVAGDTAVVVVWQPIPPRDTTFGEVLAYSVTVLRRGGEWVRVGPRRPVAGSFGKPKYAPVKLAPPKPGNRISTP